MGLFAMIGAATYQHTGCYAPLPHRVTDHRDGHVDAVDGDELLQRRPALLGLGVHLIVGIVFGMVFALIASRVGLRGAAAVPAGVVYGLVVMIFMGYIGLPVTAAVLRGGDMVSDMASLVGWWTFSAEHALYGLVLGAVWATRGITIARVRASAEARA